jgi:hypothetical protein
MRTKEQECLKYKLYYLKNAEMVKSKRRAKYAENPDKEREQAKLRSRTWRKEIPAHRNALKAKYKADKLQATPTWANLEKIKAFYTTASALGMYTGEWHHVDHIVPLRNPLVCGLHNEFNLQVITATENMKKNNNFEVA